MSKETISDMLVKLMDNSALPHNCNVSADTCLFGDNSIFDSIGLVNYIVDVETHFQNYGFELSLMSEDAMSRRKSPFRTIDSLAEFISEQIG